MPAINDKIQNAEDEVEKALGSVSAGVLLEVFECVRQFHPKQDVELTSC